MGGPPPLTGGMLSPDGSGIATPSASSSAPQETPGAPSPQASSAPEQLAPLPPLYETALELRALLKRKAELSRRLMDLQGKSMVGGERLIRRVLEPMRKRTHWDALLSEMLWAATDVHHERRWKVLAAAALAAECARVVSSGQLPWVVREARAKAREALAVARREMRRSELAAGRLGRDPLELLEDDEQAPVQTVPVLTEDTLTALKATALARAALSGAVAAASPPSFAPPGTDIGPAAWTSLQRLSFAFTSVYGRPGPGIGFAYGAAANSGVTNAPPVPHKEPTSSHKLPGGLPTAPALGNVAVEVAALLAFRPPGGGIDGGVGGQALSPLAGPLANPRTLVSVSGALHASLQVWLAQAQAARTAAGKASVHSALGYQAVRRLRGHQSVLARAVLASWACGVTSILDGSAASAGGQLAVLGRTSTLAATVAARHVAAAAEASVRAGGAAPPPPSTVVLCGSLRLLRWASALRDWCPGAGVVMLTPATSAPGAPIVWTTMRRSTAAAAGPAGTVYLLPAEHAQACVAALAAGSPAGKLPPVSLASASSVVLDLRQVNEEGACVAALSELASALGPAAAAPADGFGKGALGGPARCVVTPAPIAIPSPPTATAPFAYLQALAAFSLGLESPHARCLSHEALVAWGSGLGVQAKLAPLGLAGGLGGLPLPGSPPLPPHEAVTAAEGVLTRFLSFLALPLPNVPAAAMAQGAVLPSDNAPVATVPLPVPVHLERSVLVPLTRTQLTAQAALINAAEQNALAASMLHAARRAEAKAEAPAAASGTEGTGEGAPSPSPPGDAPTALPPDRAAEDDVAIAVAVSPVLTLLRKSLNIISLIPGAPALNIKAADRTPLRLPPATTDAEVKAQADMIKEHASKAQVALMGAVTTQVAVLGAAAKRLARRRAAEALEGRAGALVPVAAPKLQLLQGLRSLAQHGRLVSAEAAGSGAAAVTSPFELPLPLQRGAGVVREALHASVAMPALTPAAGASDTQGLLLQATQSRAAFPSAAVSAPPVSAWAAEDSDAGSPGAPVQLASVSVSGSLLRGGLAQPASRALTGPFSTVSVTPLHRPHGEVTLASVKRTATAASAAAAGGKKGASSSSSSTRTVSVATLTEAGVAARTREARVSDALLRPIAPPHPALLHSLIPQPLLAATAPVVARLDADATAAAVTLLLARRRPLVQLEPRDATSPVASSAPVSSARGGSKRGGAGASSSSAAARTRVGTAKAVVGSLVNSAVPSKAAATGAQPAAPFSILPSGTAVAFSGSESEAQRAALQPLLAPADAALLSTSPPGAEPPSPALPSPHHTDAAYMCRVGGKLAALRNVLAELRAMGRVALVLAHSPDAADAAAHLLAALKFPYVRLDDDASAPQGATGPGAGEGSRLWSVSAISRFNRLSSVRGRVAAIGCIGLPDWALAAMASASLAAAAPKPSSSATPGAAAAAPGSALAPVPADAGSSPSAAVLPPALMASLVDALCLPADIDGLGCDTVIVLDTPLAPRWAPHAAFEGSLLARLAARRADARAGSTGVGLLHVLRLVTPGSIEEALCKPLQASGGASSKQRAGALNAMIEGEVMQAYAASPAAAAAVPPAFAALAAAAAASAAASAPAGDEPPAAAPLASVTGLLSALREHRLAEASRALPSLRMPVPSPAQRDAIATDLLSSSAHSRAPDVLLALALAAARRRGGEAGITPTGRALLSSFYTQTYDDRLSDDELRAYLSSRAEVSDAQLLHMIRRPLGSFVGAVDAIARHQDAGGLHFSRAYGPPQPEDKLVHSPPLLITDSAIGNAARARMSYVEQPVQARHNAPEGVPAPKKKRRLPNAPPLIRSAQVEIHPTLPLSVAAAAGFGASGPAAAAGAPGGGGGPGGGAAPKAGGPQKAAPKAAPVAPAAPQPAGLSSVVAAATAAGVSKSTAEILAQHGITPITAAGAVTGAGAAAGGAATPVPTAASVPAVVAAPVPAPAPASPAPSGPPPRATVHTGLGGGPFTWPSLGVDAPVAPELPSDASVGLQYVEPPKGSTAPGIAGLASLPPRARPLGAGGIPHLPSPAALEEPAISSDLVSSTLTAVAKAREKAPTAAASIAKYMAAGPQMVPAPAAAGAAKKAKAAAAAAAAGGGGAPKPAGSAMDVEEPAAAAAAATAAAGATDASAAVAPAPPSAPAMEEDVEVLGALRRSRLAALAREATKLLQAEAPPAGAATAAGATAGAAGAGAGAAAAGPKGALTLPGAGIGGSALPVLPPEAGTMRPPNEPVRPLERSLARARTLLGKLAVFSTARLPPAVPAPADPVELARVVKSQPNPVDAVASEALAALTEPLALSLPGAQPPGHAMTQSGGLLKTPGYQEWSAHEDLLLLSAVRQYGPNWDLVREVMRAPANLSLARPAVPAPALVLSAVRLRPYRSARQCFDRFRRLQGRTLHVSWQGSLSAEAGGGRQPLYSLSPLPPPPGVGPGTAASYAANRTRARLLARLGSLVGDYNRGNPRGSPAAAAAAAHASAAAASSSSRGGVTHMSARPDALAAQPVRPKRVRELSTLVSYALTARAHVQASFPRLLNTDPTAPVAPPHASHAQYSSAAAARMARTAGVEHLGQPGARAPTLQGPLVPVVRLPKEAAVMGELEGHPPLTASAYAPRSEPFLRSSPYIQSLRAKQREKERAAALARTQQQAVVRAHEQQQALQRQERESQQAQAQAQVQAQRAQAAAAAAAAARGPSTGGGRGTGITAELQDTLRTILSSTGLTEDRVQDAINRILDPETQAQVDSINSRQYAGEMTAVQVQTLLQNLLKARIQAIF